jgi:phosphoribosyl-ATP pyrophosphohydrolase
MSEPSIVSSLLEVIAERKSNPPAGRSYVVSLLQAGVPKIGAKIAEEAGEVVAAAAEPGEAGRAHLVHEVADLVFHTLVLLGHQEIPWSDVEAELSRRFGVSGITEKESRTRGTPPHAQAGRRPTDPSRDQPIDGSKPTGETGCTSP